jgi:RNA polymerase-associated protein RTF1
MGTSGMEIHKGSYLRAKVVDIDIMCNRSWTNKEIQDKIDRQNKYMHLFRPTQRSALGPETLERDDALHRRNMESRRRNEQQVRRALLKERSNRAKRAAQKRKEEDAKKAEEEGKANGTAVSKAEVSKPAPISIYVPRERGSLTSMTRLKTDDEIIASIDFDIDMDI